MSVHSLINMTGVSRRLRRKLLLVLLNWVWPISLLAILVGYLASNEYAAKTPSLGEQNISPIQTQVARATNQLAENMHLSTDRVTDTVKRLINQESEKAEVQFKRTVPDAARPADGLHKAIERTLTERISNALREPEAGF